MWCEADIMYNHIYLAISKNTKIDYTYDEKKT